MLGMLSVHSLLRLTGTTASHCLSIQHSTDARALLWMTFFHRKVLRNHRRNKTTWVTGVIVL